MPPECELFYSHTMTVKHLLTDCANLDSSRLGFFDGSDAITLKLILGRNKVNSNTIEFLKERGIYYRAYKQRKHEDILSEELEVKPIKTYFK